MSELDFATILASTIHDAKNLLGSALQSAQWVEQTAEGLAQTQKLELKNIAKTISQTNHELVQLLFLYKMEKQSYRLNLQQSSLKDFVAMETAYLAHFKPDADVAIVFELERDIFAYFDPMLLGIAFRNGLMNALRYAKQQIIITAQMDPAGLKLSIDDDGPGFSKQFLDQAIDHNKQETNSHNTGLGLFFCRQVARLHALKGHVGQITIQNVPEPRQGASFMIQIPQP